MELKQHKKQSNDQWRLLDDVENPVLSTCGEPPRWYPIIEPPVCLVHRELDRERAVKVSHFGLMLCEVRTSIIQI